MWFSGIVNTRFTSLLGWFEERKQRVTAGPLWQPVLMSDCCWQGVVEADTHSLSVHILCLCTDRLQSPVPRSSGL